MADTKLVDHLEHARPPSDGSVLVAYASRYGSTRGVAERVAARIGESGTRVALRPAEQVDGLDAYDAIVFGSAVYNGDWLPEGEAFIQGNLGTLGERPVWLFSVGSLGDTHRIVGPLMKKEPRGISELQETIHPRDYRVFAGAVEPDRWSFVGRLVLRAFGGRLGDNRDWHEIDAWAEGIAQAANPGSSVVTCRRLQRRSRAYARRISAVASDRRCRRTAPKLADNPHSRYVGVRMSTGTLGASLGDSYADIAHSSRGSILDSARRGWSFLRPL